MTPVAGTSFSGVTSAATAVAPHIQKARQPATRLAAVKVLEDWDEPLLEDMNLPHFIKALLRHSAEVLYCTIQLVLRQSNAAHTHWA
jgi:hypothetical protein